MSHKLCTAAAFAASLFVASMFGATATAQTTMKATLVASGLVNPDGMYAPEGDTNRLFIVEQASAGSGRIRILDLTQTPPVLLPTPYLTVSPILAGGEEGLLGLAFHPNFANNGYFFVFYTNTAGNHQIMRYRANAPYMSSGTANASSATAVMTITHPVISNHNGGWLGFGPDGYLYIAAGEGNGSAQDMLTRLGKILRVDIDSDAFPSDPLNNYTNPPTNPYFGSTTALPEIWHSGLRNPWRASFDRANGDLWIADVGGAAFEEIDFVPAGVGGRNFGWSCMEGLFCTGSGTCVCNTPALTLPVHVYPHTSGNGCIIGGYRYRGPSMCNFQGLYFFGDFNSSRIWTVGWNGTSVQNLTDRTAELAAGGGPPINLITSFGEDAEGELYVCDALGDVFRIDPGTIVDCNQNGLHDSCDIAKGTSHDWNADGVPDECQTTGVPSCFGDGSTSSGCPCANLGAPGHGCENSAGTGGARLDGYGDPSADSVVLASSGELPHALTIFLQGDVLNPAGVSFGDGVRCAAGTLKRLYVKNASVGVARAPMSGDLSITAQSTLLGDPILPLSGQVRYYQAYYRDPSLAFCPAPAGNNWNVSGLLAITW